MSIIRPPSAPATGTPPLPENEGFAVPTPADHEADGPIWTRDPDLDAWIDDCARNDAAAEGRVWARELDAFVEAYRKHFGAVVDDPAA